MFNWFKKTYAEMKEQLHTHKWYLIYASGELHKYYCESKSCNEKRFTIEKRTELITSYDENGEMKFEWTEPSTRELSAEEAEPLDKKAMEGIRATMWILDNVEPTYSAGRDDNVDYPYKTEDGKIVPNTK